MLYTIGSGQKSLREFINLLKSAGVTRVVDIRLHNTSQLAGFSKKDDLAFILETVGIDYVHLPELAPTEELYASYKKIDKDWESFKPAFERVLAERQAFKLWTSPELAGGTNCLLCSEPKADHCHRSLVAQHFKSAYSDIEIRHL